MKKKCVIPSFTTRPTEQTESRESEMKHRRETLCNARMFQQRPRAETPKQTKQQQVEIRERKEREEKQQNIYQTSN